MIKTKQLFDREYEMRSPLFGETPTQVVTELCKLLPTGSEILELGAGDGRDSIYLLSQGYNVCSIDFSKNGLSKLVERAHKQGLDHKLTTIANDVTELKVTPASVDAVVGITILDHILATEARLLIKKIKSAVRPSGYVCIEMYSCRDPSIEGEKKEVSEFSNAINFFSPQNWLLEQFINSWRIVYYSDRLERDLDHGEPHYHGFVTILVQKTNELGGTK